MASLSTRLNSPMSEDLKAEIISRYWRRQKTEIGIEDYTLYFQFYHKTCEALYLGLRSEAKSLIVESHEHLLVIVDQLWSFIDNNQRCERVHLRTRLGEHFAHLLEHSLRHEREIKINNSINLALRLWLTIEIREEVFAPATFAIQWDDNSNLQDFIRRQFPGPRITKALTEKETLAILEGDFTAVNLRRIGGINIDWTYHLNEHLTYDRELRKIKVYTLKTCLHDQKASQANIIPDAIIDETILSLRLLFPDWDPLTSKFLDKINQPILLEEHPYPERLYLSDFHYWRDRLSEICFEYQSPPSRWRELWTDRRNRLQWYTFWLAVAIFILTTIFGLISSVTACMQTKYAYEALQLARMAAATSAPAIPSSPISV